MSTLRYAGDISPKAAWEMLSKEPSAVLIDVRTPAEWSYVGIPDLSPLSKQLMLVSWQLFPSMEINSQFAEHVASAVSDPKTPLLFLCRSGARSRSAAIALAQRGYARSYNIANGFEGDMDGTRHRGAVSGWKFDGLPWVQS